jgi:ankyrin repeat protein
MVGPVKGSSGPTPDGSTQGPAKRQRIEQSPSSSMGRSEAGDRKETEEQRLQRVAREARARDLCPTNDHPDVRKMAALQLVHQAVAPINLGALEERLKTLTFGQVVRELRKRRQEDVAGFSNLDQANRYLSKVRPNQLVLYQTYMHRITELYNGALEVARLYNPKFLEPLLAPGESATMEKAEQVLAQLDGEDQVGPHLYSMAFANRSDEVARLLSVGADPNLLNSSTMLTPLTASIGGRAAPEVVKLLLDAGADPNAGDGRALADAAHFGRDSLIQLLVDKGAKINQLCGWQKQTPLWCAAEQAKLSTVQLLIRLGADVNLANENGETPLMAASKHWGDAIVQELLAAKADPYAQGKNGRSALAIAAFGGNDSVVQRLLATDPEAVRHPSNQQALKEAASMGNAAMVARLIQAGADLETRDSSGMTPLITAAAYGRSAVVQQLLAAGANPWAKDNQGRTAAWHASQCYEDNITALLESAMAAQPQPPQEGKSQ